MSYRLAVGTQASVMVASILIVGITWYRTAGTVLLARKFRIGEKMTVTQMLLRDGMPVCSLQYHSLTSDRTKGSMYFL